MSSDPGAVKPSPPRTPAPPDLTVAVLAFNEAENLRPAVGEIVDELRARLPGTWEILIIDDGSTDGTGALADALGAEFAEVRVLHHPQNLGLGGGYRTGFDHAAGTFLIFYPADGQFPPSIIPEFFGRMAGLDMLLGHLPNRKRPPLARAASAAEKVLYRALVGKMPKFQGVLMFRTALLRSMTLRSTGRGWTILLEFILRVSRGPYRVESTPTTLRDRRAGESKVMNLRTVRANVRGLLLLRQALAD